MLEELKRYQVITNSYDDQDALHEELMCLGGDHCVPLRSCERVKNIPNSRISTFLLTDEEAETLRQDSRVLSVESDNSGEELKDEIMFIDSGTFEKGLQSGYGFDLSKNPKSWALLRCTTRSSSEDLKWSYQRAGSSLGGGIFAYDTNFPSGALYNVPDPEVDDPAYSDQIVSTVATGLEGNNVDIVIMDEAMITDSPEWAVNRDGTGGSRFVEYNWWQHNEEVLDAADLAIAPSTYIYAGNDPTADHGTCCGSVAAGNTTGFARKANIYNLNMFSSSSTGSSIEDIMSAAAGRTGNELLNDKYVYAYGYVKAFHNNKPINPKTGRKNPTVLTMSLGIGSNLPGTGYKSITFDGVTTDILDESDQVIAGRDADFFRERGWPVTSTSTSTSPSLMLTSTKSFFLGCDVAAADMVDAGVIYLSSAGNSDQAMYKEGDDRFTNTYVTSILGTKQYYLQYRYPNHAQGKCISVGALSPLGSDRKSNYSNKGTRIDIWAPAEGSLAVSSSSASALARDSSNTTTIYVDPRDSNFSYKPFGGTSCASPITAGVVACILQEYPWMTHQDVKDWLSFYSNKNHIKEELPSNSGTAYGVHYSGVVSDWTKTNFHLWGAPNQILYFHQDRPGTGNAFPRKTFRTKPSSGMAYPRRKLRAKG